MPIPLVTTLTCAPHPLLQHEPRPIRPGPYTSIQLSADKIHSLVRIVSPQRSPHSRARCSVFCVSLDLRGSRQEGSKTERGLRGLDSLSPVCFCAPRKKSRVRCLCLADSRLLAGGQCGLSSPPFRSKMASGVRMPTWSLILWLLFACCCRAFYIPGRQFTRACRCRPLWTSS